MTATERMTASVDPFVLTAPVRPGQTAGLLAVDALPALALLAAASSLVTAGGAALGGIAAAGAVAAIGAGIAMLARTGQSLGGLAARVRIVDRGTGAATGAALLPRLLTGRLRRGRTRGARGRATASSRPRRSRNGGCHLALGMDELPWVARSCSRGRLPTSRHVDRGTNQERLHVYRR